MARNVESQWARTWSNFSKCLQLRKKWPVFFSFPPLRLFKLGPFGEGNFFSSRGTIFIARRNFRNERVGPLFWQTRLKAQIFDRKYAPRRRLRNPAPLYCPARKHRPRQTQEQFPSPTKRREKRSRMYNDVKYLTR